MNILDYTSDYKNVYVSGDIHGEFRTLNYNIRRLGIVDAVIIVAGDCGIGFEKIGHYEHLYRKIYKILEKRNCILLLVRGNHDDPLFFEKSLIDFPRMKTLPDYSIVKVARKLILCVGGAISLDRYERQFEVEMQKSKGKPEISIYWEEEYPVYKENKLQEIVDIKLSIDTVITHTAPSFCYPQTKNGFEYRLLKDDSLLTDVQNERTTMDQIYEKLRTDGHIIKDWMYGHFHSSHVEFIEETRFSLLDIDEMKELTNN